MSDDKALRAREKKWAALECKLDDLRDEFSSGEVKESLPYCDYAPGEIAKCETKYLRAMKKLKAQVAKLPDELP